MEIRVQLDWLTEPSLQVHQHDDHVAVTAHAGLSQAQVRAACDQIDGHGDAIYAAWHNQVNGQQSAG